MNLYNALCGKNNFTDTILDIINMQSVDFIRYRDCCIFKNQIYVFTRNDLNNVNAALFNKYKFHHSNILAFNNQIKKHPNYLFSKHYEESYITFVFSIPQQTTEDLILNLVNYQSKKRANFYEKFSTELEQFTSGDFQEKFNQNQILQEFMKNSVAKINKAVQAGKLFNEIFEEDFCR